MSKYYFTDSVRTLQSALKVMGFEDMKVRDIMKLETFELEILIRDLWKQRAFETHPDRQGNEEEFKRLNQAHRRVLYLLPKHHSRSYYDAMYLVENG